jgi:tetratricopeptide (TPR) repeat protein
VGEAEAACDRFEDPKDQAGVLSEVAAALRRAGRRDEAREVASRAVVTAQRIGPGLRRDAILDRLARELAALGDYRQALAVCDQVSRPSNVTRRFRGDADLDVQFSYLFSDSRRRDVLRASIEALCQDGRPSEAVTLVEELTDDGQRVDADLALVGCLKTAGLDDLAVEATRDAEDRLARIETAKDRLSAVISMIQALVQAHLDIDAERYLHQFLEAVAQLKDPASRNVRLRTVGKILLETGELQWARRVFENLEADDKLDRLLELLPPLLTAGSMEDAALVMTQCLALADTCSTPAAAAEARVRILVAAGDRCDPSLTAAMVGNIQSLVQHVSDLEARSRLLTSAIAPLARLLPQADVLRIVRDVESTADVIPQQDPRASVLAGLASTLLDADMRVRARQAAMLAEAAAQVDPSADIRIGDVEGFVDTLCRVGDTQRARVVAEQLPDPQVRQRLLSKVAARHTAANPDAEELHARRNQDPYLQSVGLVDAALAFVTADRPRDARRLCADAERQSRNVKTPYYRLGLWINLADVFLSLRDTDNAQRLVDEVVTRLTEVSRTPSRALVMARLTGLLARMGRQADAEGWSNRSEELALSLTRPSTQAHALCELAVSVAPFDPGRAHRLLAQSLAVGPWPVPLTALAALDPDALREVVDSGFQFVPPLRTGGVAGHEP